MEKIGVMAVVDNLNSFLGDMNKVDGAISGLIPSNTLLGKAFSTVAGIVSGTLTSALNVLEYVLGNLVADAIRFVVDQIRELISATIEAGSEFQSLQIRLRNFNLNDALETTDDFSAAMTQATAETQSQLTWLQRLAATTPYDASDIANVYTLARSYSFADDASRNLTESITSFAAGMGLGSTEIERIVVNFGQMVQQGKVTQREMNDLARGAFVPVNDVLKVMQEQTGLTGQAFEDFRNSAEGVNAFMVAFETLVKDRFTGSTQAMARTWEGATSNVKDFIQSLVGLNVVKPILDVLGESIATALDAFTNPERFMVFQSIFTLIGGVLSDIVGDIIGVGLSAEEMAKKFQDGLFGIFKWLLINKEEIVAWAKSVQQWVGEVGAWIQEKVITAFEKISTWVSDNEGKIGAFFAAIGEIISTVFGNLFGDIEGGDPLQGLLDGITRFMDFVVANKDGIAEFITGLIQVVAVFAVVQTIVSAVIGVLMWLASIVATVAITFAVIQSAITTLTPVFVFLGTVIAGLSVPFLVLIGLIAILAYMVVTHGKTIVDTWTAIGQMFVEIMAKIWSNVSTTWNQLWAIIVFYTSQIIANISTTWSQLLAIITNYSTQILNSIKNAFAEVVTSIRGKMTEAVSIVKEKFNEAKSFIASISWVELGANLVRGLISGIVSQVGNLIETIAAMAAEATSTVSNILGIQSPSTVFKEIGLNLMEGFALGITQGSSMALDVMKSVSKSLSAPMLQASQVVLASMPSQSMPSSVSNYNTSNNFNLQVNNPTNGESIVADFNMLQSLQG